MANKIAKTRLDALKFEHLGVTYHAVFLKQNVILVHGRTGLTFTVTRRAPDRADIEILGNTVSHFSFVGTFDGPFLKEGVMKSQTTRRRHTEIKYEGRFKYFFRDCPGTWTGYKTIFKIDDRINGKLCGQMSGSFWRKDNFVREGAFLDPTCITKFPRTFRGTTWKNGEVESIGLHIYSEGKVYILRSGSNYQGGILESHGIFRIRHREFQSWNGCETVADKEHSISIKEGEKHFILKVSTIDKQHDEVSDVTELKVPKSSIECAKNLTFMHLSLLLGTPIGKITTEYLSNLSFLGALNDDMDDQLDLELLRH